jgi:DNA-binding Xre family transcriptional regulator
LTGIWGHISIEAFSHEEITPSITEQPELWSQQFSREMGISDSTLHRMEMGEQNVTLKTLERICDRLKCKISELFGEK